MPSIVKLNALLSLPPEFTGELVKGKTYTIKKPGIRIIPIGVAVEFADDNNKYLGKAVVREVKATEEWTEITFEILKIFTKEESQIFSDNFITKDQLKSYLS